MRKSIVLVMGVLLLLGVDLGLVSAESYVKIFSNPSNADVYVSSQYFGKTPVDIPYSWFKYPLEPYTLTLEKSGYADWEYSFQPVSTSLIDATLTPITTPPQKPKIVVLANNVDFALANDFFTFLSNNGIETVHTTSQYFDQYKTEKFIVILGGPDAYGGVGEIVQECLMNDEQSYLRTKGNRKIFTKTNVWTTGQKVFVIAGSNRRQTQYAHVENRGGIASTVI